MLKVFLEVVLPVALVAIAGGVVGRWRGIVVGPVSALVFYLFSPALVFHSMQTTQVSPDLGFKIVAVMLVTFAAMYVFAPTCSARSKNSCVPTALVSSTPPHSTFTRTGRLSRGPMPSFQW